jgi:hypothetical protein
MNEDGPWYSDLAFSLFAFHNLGESSERSRELRGVLVSEPGTNPVDVLEKLDILVNDSGKEEYDVRTELSDAEAKELRADPGCESVAEA